ncbi:MAG: putative DNA-binding domain-containing protein [Limisphaerales bacterium]
MPTPSSNFPARVSDGRRPSKAPDARNVASLRQFQSLVASATMRTLTEDFTMKPRWTDGRSMRAQASRFIKPNDRLTSFERLEIYNRQYWFRLLESFHEDLPGLRAVLGQERFVKLATAYLSAHPSTSFTLRNLSRHLVRFLETHPRHTAPNRRLILDLARLEWAHIEAFDNAAEPPVTAGDLLDADLARACFRLQPHLTLLVLDYPLDDYLIALRRVEDFRADASNAVATAARRGREKSLRPPRREAIWLAVHRHRNCVHYKRLTDAQYCLLKALHQGSTLTQACERALANHPNTRPEEFQRWFADWALLGWFWLPKSGR